MRHNVVVAESAAKADVAEMQEYYPHPWMSVALETGQLEEGLDPGVFGPSLVDTLRDEADRESYGVVSLDKLIAEKAAPRFSGFGRYEY